MAVLTGANGELRFRGTRVAKCRNYSLNISRDALETTSLGVWDRTFVEGLRGATGSATVLYDPEDGSTTALLNRIFSNENSADTVNFVFSNTLGKTLEAEALITSTSPGVSVGEAVACEVNFTISGSISGRF